MGGAYSLQFYFDFIPLPPIFFQSHQTSREMLPTTPPTTHDPSEAPKLRRVNKHATRSDSADATKRELVSTRIVYDNVAGPNLGMVIGTYVHGAYNIVVTNRWTLQLDANSVIVASYPPIHAEGHSVRLVDPFE